MTTNTRVKIALLNDARAAACAGREDLRASSPARRNRASGRDAQHAIAIARRVSGVRDVSRT